MILWRVIITLSDVLTDIHNMDFVQEPGIPFELPNYSSSETFCEPAVEDNEEPPLEDVTFPGSSEDSLVTWTLVFLLQLQVAHSIPDKAINSIFKFFKTLLKSFSNKTKDLSIERYQLCFPASLHMALKRLNIASMSFNEFPVCPGCKSVYTREECIETCGSRQRAKVCKKRVGRSLCNCDILTSKQSADGSTIFRPIQTYCYKSVGSMIASRAAVCPTFFTECEAWRRKRQSELSHFVYSDVHDGAMWKDLQTSAMDNFLQTPYSLALQINIDWFQPFDHVTYSVGAIYITVLNLPSTQRYKLENMFLVAILPGPDEPKHDINEFLRPLVDELLTLWDKGIQVKLSESCSITVKCAIGCLSCDIPASRKVAGFIGHSGRLGCSKCFKEFKSVDGFGGNLDCSGFNRQEWPKRSNVQHRMDVRRVQSCTSKTAREKMESELGCRYSALLDLSYFDPVRMTVIDPMHNLFLGTAKRFMAVLLDAGKLHKSQLGLIQEVVCAVTVPDGVGRILNKINSSFSGLTAEQWMNWTVIYSVIALKEIVSNEILECWRHFVLACHYLLKTQLTNDDIQIADALLLQFCIKFESLFGADSITPNMHLHCHLGECVLDFGPPRNFWLFAFERYNGILEGLPTNNCNVEPQLMRKFLRESEISSIPLAEEHARELHSLLPLMGVKDATNTVAMAKPTPDSLDIPSKEILIHALCQHEKANARDVTLSTSFCKYPFFSIKRRKFGSKLDRSSKDTIVLAQWSKHLYGEPTSEVARHSKDVSGKFYLRPFIVSYYLDLNYCIQGSTKSIVVARGCWPKYDSNYNYFGKPYTVWCSTLVESKSEASFIFLDQIVHNCAHVTLPISGINSHCVCPIIS